MVGDVCAPVVASVTVDGSAVTRGPLVLELGAGEDLASSVVGLSDAVSSPGETVAGAVAVGPAVDGIEAT